eukprot:TRINITY_DN15529_c0_g1_i1.p1 TRINITY_DN15529_c0_g1~~TRINITY_DN15529_c0_g1_i1.p1  ORF type:complete len:129 (-),score=14.32 TRINITY_DN15529_c0_g1_i1:56-442(-)
MEKVSMNFRQIKSWHWVLIVIVLLVALDWVIQRPDPKTRELNDILTKQASQKLKDYPYKFHVIRVEGKTAVMSTPRNFDSGKERGRKKKGLKKKRGIREKKKVIKELKRGKDKKTCLLYTSPSPRDQA